MRQNEICHGMRRIYKIVLLVGKGKFKGMKNLNQSWCRGTKFMPIFKILISNTLKIKITKHYLKICLV